MKLIDKALSHYWNKKESDTMIAINKHSDKLPGGSNLKAVKRWVDRSESLHKTYFKANAKAEFYKSKLGK